MKKATLADIHRSLNTERKAKCAAIAAALRERGLRDMQTDDLYIGWRLKRDLMDVGVLFSSVLVTVPEASDPGAVADALLKAGLR